MWYYPCNQIRANASFSSICLKLEYRRKKKWKNNEEHVVSTWEPIGIWCVWKSLMHDTNYEWLNIESRTSAILCRLSTIDMPTCETHIHFFFFFYSLFQPLSFDAIRLQNCISEIKPTDLPIFKGFFPKYYSTAHPVFGV